MALIDAAVDPALNYVVVRANSAAEMVQKLQAAAATLDVIADLELESSGAAPHFVATLVDTSEVTSVPSLSGSAAAFLCLGGIGGIDPLALVEELQAQIIALGTAVIYKVLIAGGGAGPHWMALVIYDGD